MDNSRRPPHYYGLPSRAPRRHKPPAADAASSTTATATAPPRSDATEPVERPAAATAAATARHATRNRLAPDAATHRSHPHSRHLHRPRLEPHRPRLEPVRDYYTAHAHTPPQAQDDDIYETEGARGAHRRLRHAPAPHAAPDPEAVPRRRRSKRRRASRVPTWKRARRVALMLAGILGVELGIAALTAPQFSVAAVETPKTLKVTPRAEVENLTAGLVGQNFIRARSKPVISAIKRLPAVHHATIVPVLAWPPRLAVQVEERTPFARVGVGENAFVVDRDGVPFRPSAQSDAALYAISGPVFRPALGQALPPKSWESVLQFVTELKKRDVRWTLQGIEFDPQGAASLNLRNASRNKLIVLLGTERWSDKLIRMGAALDYFQETGRDPAVLDLRVYSRPVWRPRGSQPEAAATAKPSGQETATTPALTDSGAPVPDATAMVPAGTTNESSAPHETKSPAPAANGARPDGMAVDEVGTTSPSQT